MWGAKRRYAQTTNFFVHAVIMLSCSGVQIFKFLSLLLKGKSIRNEKKVKKREKQNSHKTYWLKKFCKVWRSIHFFRFSFCLSYLLGESEFLCLGVENLETLSSCTGWNGWNDSTHSMTSLADTLMKDNLTKIFFSLPTLGHFLRFVLSPLFWVLST